MGVSIAFFFFVLGAVVGSFLNVVIYRYNTGRSIVAGRSVCLNCGATLRWFELVPVLSFILQRGRCIRCRSRLSLQYPAVELAAGLVFVLIWLQRLPWRFTLLHFALFSLLIVIFVYDLRHKIIPDGLAYSFAGLSLVRLFAAGGGLLEAGWGIFAGLLLFSLLGLIWLVTSGRSMGLGDAKLAAGVGLLLGVRGGLSALVLAFWLGAAAGLILVLVSRLSSRRSYFTMKSEVPFAPFIVLGLSLNFFFQINVIPAF